MHNLIPKFIIDKFANKEQAGSFQASTMFIDISGFTPMTRKLMTHGKEGAEVLNYILNIVFKPVINAVYDNGGDITSFEGDAFMAIFGGNNGDIAAEQILSLFKKFGHQKTKFGIFDLSVKIGVSHGEVEWGIVGSDEHKTWYFRGEGIDGAVRAEKRCGKNQISATGGWTFLSDRDVVSIGDATPLLFPRSAKYRADTSIEGGRLGFFPESVTNFTGNGEFRDVACAFISFKEPSSQDELNQFAGKILNKTYEHGGYFEGLNFGDKGVNCLVIFGAPTAYENNVERAVDFVNAVRNDYSDIRAGVTFGTVFAGLKGSERRAIYGVIGDVVNMSARFMMKADWGEIWLDKSVHNRIKSLYKIKANRSISLKGFRGFTANYSLLEKQEMRVSFFTGDLVGRKKELNRLSRYLRPIRNDKFGGIVTVYGEAGVGKSRLIYELIRKSEIRTLTGQCDSILKKSLNPFAYFLCNYFRQSETPNLEERKAVYSEIYNELVESADKTNEKELRRIESILGSVIGLYWEGSIYDMIEAKDKPTVVNFAIKSFIKILCTFEPLILLIEDLQWIDEASQDALQILTRLVGDVPFIILASSRFNDDGLKPTIKSDGDVKRRDVVLKDLEEGNIERLIENNLSEKPNAELVKYVRSRAEGNPFYIEQFCLYLNENGLISEPSTEGVVELVSKPTDIPTDINAVIIARVDRLSSELKDLVQVASVLGREFEVQVLEEVLSLLKEKEAAGTQ